MVSEKRGLCPYEGCSFNCKSKYHHRARYAYITKSWKKKVKKLYTSKNRSDRVDWEALRKLGILYNLKNIDHEQNEQS